MAAFPDRFEPFDESWDLLVGGVPRVWRRSSPRVTRLRCDLDLRAIRCLVVLSDEHNYTRAAERLHMSQSGVSRSILALEERVGALLVTRGARPMSLTRQGEILADHGRRLLAAQQAALDDVLNSRWGP